MNPDAIEWLEGLDERAHAGMFTPSLPSVGATSLEGSFFSTKPDHEACMWCGYARAERTLLVVE